VPQCAIMRLSIRALPIPLFSKPFLSDSSTSQGPEFLVVTLLVAGSARLRGRPVESPWSESARWRSIRCANGPRRYDRILKNRLWMRHSALGASSCRRFEEFSSSRSHCTPKTFQRFFMNDLHAQNFARPEHLKFSCPTVAVVHAFSQQMWKSNSRSRFLSSRQISRLTSEVEFW